MIHGRGVGEGRDTDEASAGGVRPTDGLSAGGAIRPMKCVGGGRATYGRGVDGERGDLRTGRRRGVALE